MNIGTFYEWNYEINPSHYEENYKIPSSMRDNKTLSLSKWHQSEYSVHDQNFITTYGSIAEPSLVINGRNELSSDHQSTHVVVKLDSLQQMELPMELSEIAQAIEESKYILELTDNFDEEGAKACEFATWERAVRFLIEYSEWVFKSFHYVIDRPQIYDGPHGSIDMLWRTDRYRWLINFPEDRTQPASFYGDDFKLDQIKGTFNPSIDSRRVFMFLLGANQTMWPIEEIPDQDSLYYRVHQSYLMKGELKPGAFREIGDGMSTDWSKYSTPLDSRNRAKKPEQNGIISLKVGSLRGCFKSSFSG